MSDPGPQAFESVICRVEGAMQPHGIPIPDEVSEKFWKAGIKRLLVSINGYELRRGLQGSRELGSHLVVGKNLLKQAGVALDDKVSVILSVDPDPNYVEVCEEFLIALEQDAEAKERWEGLTPGMQRSLAHYVNGAKREETRVRRALEMAMKLRTRTLHGD